MAKSIKGLDSLIRKLEKLQGVAVTDAIEKACLLVESEAKQLCPVDDGQLRQSITSELVNDTTGAVGTNIEYAPYVHQGTGIYAINGDGRQDRWSYQDAEGNWHSTIGQAPNPFLERALDNNRKEINKIFKDKIKECAK